MSYEPERNFDALGFVSALRLLGYLLFIKKVAFANFKIVH